MFCCKPTRKKKEEDDKGELIPSSPVIKGNNASIQSMHDYIYSPKDFCDTVLQKKLIPEFYLNGIEPPSELRLSQDSMSRTNLRTSQDIHRSQQDLRKSQSDMRRSQNDLRKSKSELKMSQGAENQHPEVKRRLVASQGDERNNSTIGGGGAAVLVDVSVEDLEQPSLRSSQETSALPPDDASGAMTPRRGSARYSSFFSTTSYTNINYYEEFCALFPHFAIVPTDGFRVELGGRATPGQELFLQEQDAFNMPYQRIFAKNDHNNFVGGDASTPFIISILACDDVEGGCRTILRTKNRDHHIIVPYQTPPIKMARYALAQIRKVDPAALPSEKEKLVINQIPAHSFIVKDLSNFEDKAYKSKHKMGILYCKGGQTTEEEMFCNLDPSPEFAEFLDMMGTRIPLRGLPITQFSGGLDTKSDLTGTESYYTTYEGIEIMFHVSTLLPFTPDRPIQIERKKHIGNDVVCIVFMDSPTPFKPTTITSKFIHVLIVVQFLERNSNNKPVYRISVASKPGVEPHHPVLPTPPHFEGGESFRQFLLTKAINAERAAMHAPAFKLARTRMNGLSTIVEKHTEEIPPKKCFG